MTSIPNGFPISLRSWANKSTDTTDLPTFFQRVNIERGGFLNFNEESLREEIAREEAGQVVEADSEEDEDKGTDDAKAKAAAREELLQQIGTAHQSAMFQLEFISLLLSKENPAPAGQTITPHLRERVGLGTLGASKASAPWGSHEQRDDNKLVARGWKTRDVGKAIDSILASATRLESEIQKETRYWEELLDLNEQGWNICKVPRRKGVMGVRLGSQEASPVLRSQGLAVLSRNESGSLYLNPDPITVDPKVLRIRIQVNGKITGTSPISTLVPRTAPIRSLLHQTRNTLFALELWHELNRESRTLGSFSIHPQGTTLLFPVGPTKTAVLDLFSLSDRTTSPLSESDDTFAHALSLALHHLLSHSHRQSLRRRSQPQPPKPNPKRLTQANPPTNKFSLLSDSPTLLRPLLTALNHHTSLANLHSLFHLLTTTLRKSSLSYLPIYTATPIPTALPPSLSLPERVIFTLTSHLSDIITFRILPGTELKVMLRTSMTALPPTTAYNLQIHPETSELSRICPSPGTLARFEQVEAYVLFLTSAAMARQFTIGRDAEAEGEEEGWKPTYHPTTLKYFSSSSSTPSLTLPSSGTTAANDKFLTFSLHALPLTSSTAPTTDAETGKVEKERKGMKLRITYLHDSEFETGGFKGLVDENVMGQLVDRRLGRGEKREGEGCYEWIVWDDGDSGKEGVEERGNEEVAEVVKSIGDVVREAERG